MFSGDDRLGIIADLYLLEYTSFHSLLTFANIKVQAENGSMCLARLEYVLLRQMFSYDFCSAVDQLHNNIILSKSLMKETRD